MKNQYFGDVRDLFKYDVIQTLISNSTFLDKLLFISMLTPDDESNEGNKIKYNKAKAGFYNLDLLNFLHKAVQNKREVKKITEYFNEINISVDLFNELINNNSRREYFNKVLKRLKNNTLIFFDPDNGLEVKNNNEKHLLFEELISVFDQMGQESLIMIYQHFPRVKREVYIKKRKDEIEKELGSTCNYISDNEIVFFFTSKNQQLNKEVKNILFDYNQKYTRLKSGDSKSIIFEQKELELIS